MKRKTGRTMRRRIWATPMIIVGASATLLICLGNLADTSLHSEESGGFIQALFSWDQQVAQQFFSNHLAQVIGALLALAITVVSIVVQMAATQITPRVSDLFIKEPINFAVLAFFVVGCIQSEWVAL